MIIRLLLCFCIAIQQSAFSSESYGTTTIIPSVINGLCSMCHTSSCANCPKAGRLRQESRVQAQSRVCSVCSNTGPLCSQETSRTFEETGKERLTCRTTSGKRCDFSAVGPRTVYIPRSVGTNTARELVAWEEFIHQSNVGDYYLTTGHVLGSYQSVRPKSIARALFGDCVLRFAGSQIVDRGGCELLADNFGLSPYFRGSVFVNPSIQNSVLDNQFFIGLDPLYPGLYLRFHAPLVHTRWNLGLSQQITELEDGCKGFPEGAVAATASPASCSILQALQGDKSFGDMKNPWTFGHIRSGVATRTGFADIDLIIGCDFIQCDEYHFGLYGQLGIPCGNKPSARSVFAPLIGTGRHLEIALGISGHIILWQRDVDSFVGFYCEGNAAHLFKTTQHRSFDFCTNGQLSRYMLLKQLAKVDDQFVYDGTLVNGIDIATRRVSVSIPLQGDISAT
ncbi:hypothetical protein H0W26_03095, partial [Candidatus Dependentiae bacterium]|nr:hypothetical protein [Candidatus Dependentiae bacterium]